MLRPARRQAVRQVLPQRRRNRGRQASGAHSVQAARAVGCAGDMPMPVRREAKHVLPGVRILARTQGEASGGAVCGVPLDDGARASADARMVRGRGAGGECGRHAGEGIRTCLDGDDAGCGGQGTPAVEARGAVRCACAPCCEDIRSAEHTRPERGGRDGAPADHRFRARHQGDDPA